MTSPNLGGLDLHSLELDGIDIQTLGLDDIEASLITPLAKTAKTADQENGFSDMTGLTRLDEKTVLNNLEKRFKHEITYTYIGSVLVSINPFQAIEGLYENKARFHDKSLSDQPPHVFAIAEKAYTSMLTSGQNQSFVISGESGAGKTETMKQILSYLSEASTRANEGVEGVVVSEIPNKVLESNPILESFGNAKTIHNHNSSRFGKFMEIQFDALGVMIGAKMCDYLLEKTRIVHQAETERNFHVFYQLLACGDADLLSSLMVGGIGAAGFRYLNGGGCVQVDTLDDKLGFKDLENALKGFFAPVLVDGIWKVVSALLHLGNIDFTGGDTIRGISNPSTVEAAAQLLGITANDLTDFLTVKITNAGKEVIRSQMRRGEAIRTRDTLAKTVYSRMFKWILSKLNGDLCVEDMAQYCGILDIFGFEVFKTNDLEQLCINYANESLQDFFNNFVFKMEQIEYRNEGVKVKAINFTDNRDCLDMICGIPDGIFSITDDQCQLGSGTIDGLMWNFDEKLKRNAYYIKDKKAKNALAIKHYAGKVTYDATLWLEKNKESTPATLSGLIAKSEQAVLQSIFTVHAGVGRKPSKGEFSEKRQTMFRGRKQASVVSTFKKSLEELMSSLKKTQPLFIRCLKPNGAQVAKVFDQNYILNQMKSVGMVDTIRIRQIGFPVRYNFQDFNERFLVLLPADVKSSALKVDDPAKVAEYVMKWLSVEDDEYAMGNTKVFVKDSQADALENRLAAVQKSRMRRVKKAIAKHHREKEEDNKDHSAQRAKATSRLATGVPEDAVAELEETSSAADMAKVAHTSKNTRQTIPASPLGQRKAPPPPPPSGRRPSTELLSTVLKSTKTSANSDIGLVPSSVRRVRSGSVRSSVIPDKDVLRGTLRKARGKAAPSTPTGSLSPNIQPHTPNNGTRRQLNTFEEPGTSEWDDEDSEVSIGKLFLSSQMQTRVITFNGTRSPNEIERAFHRTFPSHSFPTPFPTLYITDPMYNVQYEMIDSTQIREGTLLTVHIPAEDLTVRLNELNHKLDRSLDGIQDTLRMATMNGSVTGSSPIVVSPAAQKASSMKVVASGMSDTARQSLHTEIQRLTHEAAQLRREVAVAKQSTREAHEIFMSSLTDDLTSLAEVIATNQRENFNPMAIRRRLLDRSKNSLQTNCTELEKNVSAIRSTLADMTDDVVKRKIRPTDIELSQLRCDVNVLEGNVNTLGKVYDDSRTGFKQLWKEELQLIVDDEQLMDDIEGKVEDIENDFDELARQSDAMDQLLVLRANMPVDVPVISTCGVDEEETEEVMDGVLDEIMYITVNHDDRMSKVAEMEAKMQRKKEMDRKADPLTVFTMDLSSQKGMLKKTGGVAEIERLRKIAQQKSLGFGDVVEAGGS
eukprot:CFRG4645T1